MSDFPLGLGAIPEDEVGTIEAPAAPEAVLSGGWRRYFERKDDLEVGDDICRVYSSGPIDERTPVALMIHGAGFTALSFCLLTARIKTEVSCIAIDLPGHGRTYVHDDPLAPKYDSSKRIDMSLERIVEYVRSVMRHMIPKGTQIHLIGHSLGGSIVSKILEENEEFCIKSVTIIDISEGMAMGALKQMRGVLQARPKTFSSLTDYANWVHASGTVNNKKSVRVSVLKSLLAEGDHYVSRADLESTKEDWDSWFEGLDKAFLGGERRVTRMLVCADTNRLDTPLTIGQMEGRFEVAVIKGTGHAVHEDDPNALAVAWLSMMRRHHYTQKLCSVPFVPGKIHPLARAPSLAEVEDRDPL